MTKALNQTRELLDMIKIEYWFFENAPKAILNN